MGAIRGRLAGLRRRVADQRGATLVEYALMVSLIALTCTGSLETLACIAEVEFRDTAQDIGDPYGP